MNVHFEDTLTWWLRSYVRAVAKALGLRGECSCVQTQRPMSVYLALDGRLPRFPDRDVALLWDEERGWSAAVESSRGSDLTVVDHLGHEVLSSPELIAQWVQRLRSDDFRPHARPVRSRNASDLDLFACLAAYDVDDLTSSSPNL